MLLNLLTRWRKPENPEEKRRSITIESGWGDGLKAYLSTPLPSVAARLDNVDLLAVDFETSGLKPAADKVLSVGFVGLSSKEVDLCSCRELYIRHGEYITSQSAVVNGLTPGQLAHGQDWFEVMEALLMAMAGKVVLAHGAGIEYAFLHQYLMERYQIASLPGYYLDTLQLEKKYTYQGVSGQHSSYQLDDLRRHYRLPGYVAHSAASDAFACAELFLAQYHKLPELRNCEIGRIKGQKTGA